MPSTPHPYGILGSEENDQMSYPSTPAPPAPFITPLPPTQQTQRQEAQFIAPLPQAQQIQRQEAQFIAPPPQAQQIQRQEGRVIAPPSQAPTTNWQNGFPQGPGWQNDTFVTQQSTLSPQTQQDTPSAKQQRRKRTNVTKETAIVARVVGGHEPQKPEIRAVMRCISQARAPSSGLISSIDSHLRTEGDVIQSLLVQIEQLRQENLRLMSENNGNKRSRGEDETSYQDSGDLVNRFRLEIARLVAENEHLKKAAEKTALNNDERAHYEHLKAWIAGIRGSIPDPELMRTKRGKTAHP
jgi:hypothetical protein